MSSQAGNEQNQSAPVAVFDSGVGGLTVLHECLVSLPHEDFIYVGDTARFPYGNHSTVDLQAYAVELAEFLLAEGAKLLVVACNSASAAALPYLRERFEQRVGVVAVIAPEAKLAAAATASGKIGLLATPATVASQAYARALESVAPQAQLTSVACPQLASMIQDTTEFDAALVAEVNAACDPLRAAEVDTVILGCTHYPLVRSIIQRAMGRGVTLVSSGEAIADQIQHELVSRGVEADHNRRGTYSFFSTGDPEQFRRAGTRFLQMPMGDVALVPDYKTATTRPAPTTTVVDQTIAEAASLRSKP